MKTIFWNVDTQYDFMRSDGKLYIAGAEAIEGNLEKLTKHARKHGITIVNSCDWHNEKTEELSITPNFVTTFPEHCMEYTPGADFIPATRPENPLILNWEYSANWNGKNENVPLYYANKTIEQTALDAHKEIVIRKDKFNVFTGNPWTGQLIDKLQPTRIVAYGVARNVCLDNFVLGALEHLKKSEVSNYELVVAIDATKELAQDEKSPIYSPKLVKNWQDNGIKLITTDEVIRLYQQ